MSEINGLRNIIASAGTMHGITEPPEPCEFADRESYERAYDQWYADVCCWKSTRIEL